ncbi:MAG: phosphoribosylanthranilate isomerase [Planctomycetota bacterium]
MIVKICGITRPQDAQEALDCGADWVGLNFVGGPRCIDLSLAEKIIAGVTHEGRFVALVSIASDPENTKSLETFRDIGIFFLQIYGDVSPRMFTTISEMGFKIIRPVRTDKQVTVNLVKTYTDVPEIDYLLIDSHVPGLQGGTGKTGDWNAIRDAFQDGDNRERPAWILAGGLNAENVSEAITLTRPDGVDVSSGVESSPGRKDSARMRAFVAAARNA